MVTAEDFKESKATLKIIAHVKDADNAPHRLSFVKILEIIDFILTGANRLLFTKDGKPKSKLQLIMSLFDIIMFLRDVIRMINGNLQYKPKTARPLIDDTQK
jgi:hypothetical protein